MKMIFADETVRMCFERIKNIFFSCRYKDDDRILLIPAVIVGLGLSLYAIIKYNKGLF